MCKMSNEAKDAYVFVWRIKNYSSCYLAKGEEIVSPCFTIETIPNSQWSLSFYPKGSSNLKDDERFVSYFLEWKPLVETLNTVSISFSLDIMDEKDNILKLLSCDNTFSKQSNDWGFRRFFAIDELEKKMSNWTEDILTLRCRINTDNQRKKKFFESESSTTFEVDRGCVEWYVQMPSLFEYSESLTFPISNSNSVELTLNSTEEKMKILIHFKDDESESSQQLTCTLSLFDKIGCKLGSKRYENVCKSEETWTFPDFITKEMLRCCEEDSSKYRFTLKCDVCISRKAHTSSIERLKFVSPCSLKSIRRDIPISAMQSNFRNIFLNQNYSDVTIRCKNDEFSAHKFVLKVRSPVFAAMFDQDMLENKTGVVDIADTDGKTLKAFLEFLYTDKADKLDYDIAKNLILTADKYQVPSLVDMCASFLISIISIENVCEIIAIADMIDCKNLKSFALNFIKVNAAKVLPTAAWTEWIQDNIKLATYILSELSTAIGTNYKLI